jgi:hypothetical protein
MVVDWPGCGRASGLLWVLLRLLFRGCGLDGADFDVGMLAGVVNAFACDPDLAFTEHSSLIVDEEGFVLLLFDDGGDVGRDDVVVVFDEGFRSVEVGGFAVKLDADGIADESGYGGGIVPGYSLLEIDNELANFRMGVVADHGVDGFIDVGRGGGWLGGAALREGVRDKETCQDEKACQLGSEFHFRLQ